MEYGHPQYQESHRCVASILKSNLRSFLEVLTKGKGANRWLVSKTELVLFDR